MSISAPSRFVITAVGIAGTSALAACGIGIDVADDPGPTVTEVYDVDDFDQLEVDSAWEVTVEIGPEVSLEIDVDEDHLDKVEIDSDGDRLSLSMDGGWSGGWFFSSGRATQTARITTPSLRDLTLNGAAEVEIDELVSDRLEVDLNGASSVDLGLIDLDRLEIELNGASTIDGAGTAETVVIEANGASSVEFASMIIDEAEIDAEGASSLDLEGASTVSGRAGGASSVDVDDDATVSVRTSGASSVG